MAEASISVFQDQFSCSICLDLLKDPVTINCGHSFCMSCITACWNQEDQKRVYSCPQCRQTFTPRPALGKNVILAEMVEKVKKTKLQTDRCDVCTGRKRKAVKSCLVCLESYCQTHFERHEGFHTGKRHKVTEATGRLQEMICSQHDRLLEVFCRTDQRCVCYLCTMDEHKNHDTVSAAAERTEKQRSAQTAVEDTERIFSELIRSIERRRSEVIQLIRDQEKTAVSRAEGLLKELEQEIDDLRRRHDEMERLSHTEHHISFLQSFQSLSESPGSTDNISVSSLLSFDDVGKSVTQLKVKVEDFCKIEIERISDKVSHIEIIPTNEAMTRTALLQYFRPFSLDPNTVHQKISLSEGNSYPDHPDRFDYYHQVLCRESVCGRCYWEVEWSGWVYISVSYKSINRKGRTYDCLFGYNDESWSLLCSSTKCSFWHDHKQTELPVVSSSSRIGVYVDHSAGILTFYSISDTMTLTESTPHSLNLSILGLCYARAQK
ncbi:finTRIM family [Triplophysa rosa]|uniref:FinTRIM family n=1 Tax=Triplophysa rosa TaxID=992332 RepID=A0A9W7T5X8_TRIRA|nr:finTRIM family [Triplophysa rosa]